MMTLEKLRLEIANILDIPPADIRDDSSPETVGSWDSMASLAIISFLDDAYNGEMTQEEAESLTTFRAIVNFALMKGILHD